MRMPPKFSELKKQADEINNPIDKLNFWIDQKRQYVQESSWKMREVTVFDDTDVYKTDDLKRRSGKFKQTGRDHNLISIEAEIESLKAHLEFNDIEIKKGNRPKPKNELAQKMFKTAEKNRPKKEAIINKAVEIIKDTGKEYRTPKNNCRKWLWDDARIKKIDKGNARTWLDNAVKDGTINKKLKRLPME